MQQIALLLIAAAMEPGIVAALALTSAPANAEPASQGANEVHGLTPYGEIENETAPNLIVHPRGERSERGANESPRWCETSSSRSAARGQI